MSIEAAKLSLVEFVELVAFGSVEDDDEVSSEMKKKKFKYSLNFYIYKRLLLKTLSSKFLFYKGDAIIFKEAGILITNVIKLRFLI